VQPSDPAFASLYELAPCGLLLTAADGAILHANQTFCRWVGLDLDTLRRRRFQDLLTMGGRIFHQTHWAPLLQMQGSVAEVKLMLQPRDGPPLPMMLNAVRREAEGGVRHELALFVAEDRNAYERELMLARRRAEAALSSQIEAQEALALTDARLRLALDAAQLYVWSVDPGSGERRYDPKVALLLGAGAPEPVEPARFRAAIHPDDLPHVVAAFERLLEGGVFQCRYRLRGEDGVERVVQAVAGTLADDGHGVRHVIGLLQDITELSAQRAAAEDRALLAEQMIGIVSHDLRNPLSAILMGSTALQQARLAEPAGRVTHHIAQSARRAKRMIDDLLDFSAARMGRGISVAPRPVQLHVLVAGFVEELGRAHPTHRLRHVAQGGPEWCVDPDRLFQLIGNLVSNAASYGAPDHPVTIESSVGPGQCAVSVHNHGAPIPPELLPGLFLPLVRGAHDERGSRSVGLGLYIVSEIARAHGGTMEVESELHAGTRFTLRMARPPALAA
jgi:phosphoserine phosphatase RsbU/P